MNVSPGELEAWDMKFELNKKQTSRTKLPKVLDSVPIRDLPWTSASTRETPSTDSKIVLSDSKNQKQWVSTFFISLYSREYIWQICMGFRPKFEYQTSIWMVVWIWNYHLKTGHLNTGQVKFWYSDVCYSLRNWCMLLKLRNNSWLYKRACISSKVHNCAMENRQLITTCTCVNLSE